MEETDVSGKYIQANGLSKQYTESEIREDTRALSDNQNLTYLRSSTCELAIYTADCIP